MTEDIPKPERADLEAADDDGEVEKTSTLGGRVGKAINGAISRVLWTIAANVIHLLWWLTRWRRGEKLWKKLGLGFIKKYHKAAGGDRLGFVEQPNGQVDLMPVKYVPAEKCDEEEQPGWRSKDLDKAWQPTDAGEAQLRLGSTPIVPLSSDSHRSASYAEASVAEAIDQGRDRPLYRVDEANLEATIDMQGGAGQANAVADGGQIFNRSFDPRGSPIFEDMIVELGGDGYEGTAVSFRKVQEMYAEKTTSEEMRKQETRGFIAGRSAKDWGSMAIKMMLIALGIIAVVVLGPPLISNVLGGGGGGGGGGSIIPIFLGVVG